jgi:thiamine-phosphate pyrophosphorylase
MRGLYAIVDTKSLRARGIDPVAFAAAILDAKPAALQLRAKDLSPRECLALLRRLSPLCKNAGVPLVANDRADLAALAACDYVHVGQTDLPIESVRRITKGLCVGVSTHDLEQLARALDRAPDYVAYGPIFPTNSKDAPEPIVGIVGLEQASKLTRRARVPLVAIGGITVARAAEVGCIADAAAVISALLPENPGRNPTEVFQDVTARARHLQCLLSVSRAAPEERPEAARA